MDLERILDFYRPAKTWIEKQIAVKNNEIPLVGVSAPQGTGKSTFANYLVRNFKEENNLNVLEISIDDFYLTRKAQLELAKNTGHPYLQERGYPGTHDMPLMYEVLEALKQGKVLPIPRYNKSAYNGKGDRFPEQNWTKLENRPDLIVLEGWMLGFAPVKNVINNLELINSTLEDYIKLNNMFDAFIHLHANESHFVLDWRSQAEKERRESGLGAMGQEEIINYLKLFIPCYETYNHVLLNKLSLKCPLIRFELNEKRGLMDSVIL